MFLPNVQKVKQRSDGVQSITDTQREHFHGINKQVMEFISLYI